MNNPTPSLRYFSLDHLAQLLTDGLTDAPPETVAIVVKRVDELYAAIDAILNEKVLTIDITDPSIRNEYTAQTITLAVLLESRYRQNPDGVSKLIDLANVCLIETPMGRGGDA
jgi:hypothetical protein